MKAPLRIPNRQAGHLWLRANGLSGPGTGVPDVMAIIRQIGFLQIDTIRNVTRAHNYIPWPRNPNCHEGMLWPPLGRDRALFGHFPHGARQRSS